MTGGLFLERWCALRARQRAIAWMLGTGLFVLGMYLFMVRPAKQQTERLTAQHQQAVSRLRQMRVVALPPPQSDKEGVEPAEAAFSPLAFQRDGIRLVHWQPHARGGTLTLSAEWMQIPPLFARLARSGVGISEFSVEPGDLQLRFVAQIENLHEN